MSDGGKGSKPRPFSVDQKTFDNNWDRIFKKTENAETPKIDELEEYKRQAQELWNDSCTSPRKK